MFNQSRWTKQSLFVRLVVIVLFVALLSAAGGPLFNVSAAPLAATSPVGLGTAGNFAVLAGSAVNDTNPSHITGHVGLYPGTGAAIAVACAEVTGNNIRS